MKREKIKITAILLSAALCGIAFAYTAHAAYTVPIELRPDNMPLNLDFGNGATGTSNLTLVLQLISGALLYLAAPLAVAMIAMAGFNMVAYSGVEEKAAQAKKFLTWAIMGLLLVIFSYSVIKILITFIPGTFDEVSLEAATQTTQTDASGVGTDKEDAKNPKPQ